MGKLTFNFNTQFDGFTLSVNQAIPTSGITVFLGILAQVSRPYSD